jgi:hypothetical protein
VVVGLFLGLLGAPASAQQYPPQAGTCGVSGSVSPGEQFTVTGEGFQPGSTLTFTLQPGAIDLGSTQADANGEFQTVLTAPANLAAGDYTLRIAGTGVVCVTGVDVVVAGGVTAFTGSTLNVPVWMALVAALLAGGLLFVVLGGRRRRSVRARP